MVGERAIGDGRQSARPYDTGIKQRKGAAEFTFARQLRDGPIEDRGGAIEDDSQQREQNKQRRQRQDQCRQNEQRRRGFRDNDGPNDAKTLAGDLSAHLCYGAGTGVAFWLLTSVP